MPAAPVVPVVAEPEPAAGRVLELRPVFEPQAAKAEIETEVTARTVSIAKNFFMASSRTSFDCVALLKSKPSANPKVVHSPVYLAV